MTPLVNLEYSWKSFSRWFMLKWTQHPIRTPRPISSFLSVAALVILDVDSHWRRVRRRRRRRLRRTDSSCAAVVRRATFDNGRLSSSPREAKRSERERARKEGSREHFRSSVAVSDCRGRVFMHHSLSFSGLNYDVYLQSDTHYSVTMSLVEQGL